MASPAATEDHSNTKTEEVTTAVHKKRHRRVSFAENTDVRIYDRDEDLETPQPPEPHNSPQKDLGFTEKDSDSKQFFNSEDDDDVDEFGPTRPFIQVVRSPSSAGSTISATSNDDDAFFGPVSTSFIRRDLLDSAASDENHDQTMDSSAFSMHFHSLAKSDSGDMRTSPRVHLSFEEKTSTPSSVPSNTTNYMQLTPANKPDSHPDVSTSITRTSPSNDMSLVGKYHDKYDYGKLLPVMDPLLAEDHNDLQVVSHISMLKSPAEAGKHNENGHDFMDFSYSQDNKRQDIISHEEPKEVVSVKRDVMAVADDGSKPLLNKQNEFDVLSNTSDIQASKHLNPNQSIRAKLIAKTNDLVKDAFENISGLEFLATNQGTPSNHVNMAHQLNDAIEKENKSPSVRMITRLTDTPNKMLLNGVGLFKSPGPVTPSNNQISVTRRASVSSLQKSISKLRILEASPFSDALNAKLEDSNSRSLVGLPKITLLGKLLENEGATTNTDDNMTMTHKGSFAEAASQLVLSSAETCSGEHMQQNLLKAADITYDHEGDENTIIYPQTFDSSLKKTSTARFRVSLSGDVKQPNQHDESPKFGPGHAVGLAIASDGMNSLGINGRESSLNVAVSNIEEMNHDMKDVLYDVHNNSETRGDLTNLSKDIQRDSFQSVLIDSDISMGQINASLVLNDRMDGKSCHKNLADQFGRNPCVLNNETIDSFHAKSAKSDVSSAERKRKTEHETVEKIAKVKLSSNSDLELASDSETSSTGPNLEHLAEIHTRFFKETKLLSHAVDKMNLHAIDRVGDILGQLQRLKTYQLLSNDIRSQDKRAAETRLILCKFVYEQAKLQLMQVKRERLLKNVQSLVSGIQESEILKLNHSLKSSLDVQIIHHQPSSDNIMDIHECQEDNDKMASLRQMGKEIDGRISNLIKYFHVLCKMKGEANTADTIASANNHLMRKACCQIIRKDSQLWVLDDLKNSKDHHDVVLNYLDLLFQRFTVTAGVVPCNSVTNILDHKNIQKKFRDMDASTAFGFVFDAGLLQKHVSATSFAQETQMTASLLGNLVDVMEELELAKIELKNLIYARFRTSLDEHLDLELYFFDSNRRRKATITLNTSCLKRGIYPSEIVPCQIDIPVDASQNSSHENLSAEIAGEVQDLRVGFFRILRLCRRISQLLSLQEPNLAFEKRLEFRM